MISNILKQDLSKSSWIRAMFEEGARLKKIHGDTNVFDFSIGNPDSEPPRKVKEAFIRNSADDSPGTHGYMSNAGYDELREKIAKVSSVSSGLDFKASNVVVTCGAAGGMNVALKTIIDPGDEVVIFKPYFAEYIFYVKNAGGCPVFADCCCSTYQPDPGSLEKSLSPRTKAVIINSPNNPTGIIYNSKTLKDIAELIRLKQKEYGTDILVLSDDPYREIVFGGAVPPDIFNIFDNVVRIYSYSKSLSIPGERIGYILASPKMNGAKEFIDGAVFCNRTLGFVNAPAFIQRVLLDSMESSVDPEIYGERMEILYSALTGMGFECIRPEGAFYLFPRSPVKDEVEFVKAALKYNLLLVPGRGFGLEGHFRIAYCVSRSIIIDSIPRFKQLADEYVM